MIKIMKSEFGTFLAQRLCKIDKIYVVVNVKLTTCEYNFNTLCKRIFFEKF